MPPSRIRRPIATPSSRRSFSLALIVAAATQLSCSGSGEAERPSALSEPPAIASLSFGDREAIAAAHDAWAARADESGNAAAAAALTAGRLSVMQLAHEVSTQRDVVLARARREFERAASEPAEHCPAALERARLEARLGELSAARAWAMRAGEGEAPGECAAEASRLSQSLGEPPNAPAEPAASITTLQSVSVLGLDAAEPGRARAVRILLTFDATLRLEALRPSDRLVQFTLPQTRRGEGVAEALSVDAAGLDNILLQEEEGTLRIRVQLGSAPVSVRHFVLHDPHRLVLDVQLETPRAPEDARIVLLDPGHGGDDHGAFAFGLRESRLVLDIARRVQLALREIRPDIRVLLTRDRDVFISLEQRTAIANAIHADMLVSIHLNSGGHEEVLRGGVTTFLLDTNNERQALRLAARENGTTSSEVGQLSRLLAHFHRREQVAASERLAQAIHAGTLAGGRSVLPGLRDRGVQRAMFHVLVGASMPAVLVEASFVSNREEAEALRTDRYRQALAEGIARGIAANL